jgi:hypothetical protein
VDYVKIDLAEYEKWIADVQGLAEAVEAYCRVRASTGNARLQRSLDRFTERWEYAIGKHSEDLQEYGPRLGLTRRAYDQTDQYIAEDMLRAWDGTY